MNILVIGNGFDLAHGLPTKYTDFLEWIIAGHYSSIKGKWIRFYFYNIRGYERYQRYTNNYKVHLHIFPRKVNPAMTSYSTWNRELRLCIDKNLWVEYFCYKQKYINHNWIDFEKEIGDVIQSFDNDFREISTRHNIRNLKNTFIRNRLKFRIINKKLNIKNYILAYEKAIEILYFDLNRLIRALEMYLENLKKIKIVLLSPDINNINVDKVLSFNYTNIFERMYGKGKDIEYDYIHGKVRDIEYDGYGIANIKNAINSNNMVLGVDEYLPKDRKDKDIAFIKFKKFYQRIYKQTGSEYKKWIYEIKAEWSRFNKEEKEKIGYQISQNNLENKMIHRLFIFGHSLDITDKDVLRDLILNDNVYTTIFYHDKDAMGQQIANLVKVIGQDELIRRTGGSTKTIEFKQQQDMISIENQ